MSILVAQIGNFKHPWCTEVHLLQEMRNLGMQVENFQEPSDPREHQRFLAFFETWCRANKPDVVMFTRTWGLPTETTALWRKLESWGIRTCSYHLDLYVGLQRQDGIRNDPFWTTQYVFTPDGDPASQAFFESVGINHHWLSPAVFSEACKRGYREDRFDYDVVFVGSEHYHPEWPWRPKLIQHLRATYGDRFRRFSGDCAEGPIREQALNNLYATARVVVGDSLALPKHVNYWTDRYFETVGRGGFLIGPKVAGIEAFLDERHMAFYDHPNGRLSMEDALREITDKIDYFLANPAAREERVQAGVAHVGNSHTYKHRLAQAFKIMGFDISAANKPPAFIPKLELGSGYHPTPGFTHLDINPNAPGVDIVGSAFPLDLPDESVGEIRAVDVLEHLSYWDTARVLADWHRVLCKGGQIYVQVPDAARIMEWFVTQPELLVERLPAGLPKSSMAGAAWRMLGGHHDGVYAQGNDDWKWNAHYAMFSSSSLRAALTDAGFTVDKIESNNHPNLLCWATKP